MGFSVAAAPANLLWALAGVTLGTAVGVLPGIGPALTVALLLPATLSLDPTSAFIMFAGIYYGAMYGGSTSAILLNTPGESASIATALEGHRMARRGRGQEALATAALGSFLAGTLATAALTFTAPALVQAALHFGPAEYFALAVFAFTSVSAVLGRSLLKGLASLFLGLGLGLVGIDPLTGKARFSLGVSQLLDGIDVPILVLGLFAVGETFYLAWCFTSVEEEVVRPTGGRGLSGLSREDWSRSWPAWLRGAALGFPFGILPAGGAEIPTFLSYALEKRLARKPEEFGQGAIEGVAGPEAANNAAAGGVLVPLLSLGLPTSATAAVLLAAFQQYGLRPGPLLFDSQPELVWSLIASLYLGNAMLLVLNVPLAGIWVRVLLTPKPLLYGAILVLASLGAYSLNGSIVDVALVYLIGVLGAVLRRYDFPVAPTVLGLILGPMAEQQARRALSISQGQWTVFLARPLSAAVLAVAVLALVVPRLLRRRP
jgi:putative tricarboxylic transport membrane protein